jgi:peptide/nickel transport system permease protein
MKYFDNLKSNKLIKRLLKDDFVMISSVILIFMYTTIGFAGFFSPYSKYFSDRKLSYSPPSKIFVINQGKQLSWPYIYNYKMSFNPETFRMDYKLDRSQKFYLKFLSKGQEYKLFGVIPANIHFVNVDEPGRLFILGTDINGRDILSRVFYGGQISLTIGFLALFISFPIGLLYGGISGYFGGALDNIMMRIAEAIMSIPSFYLLISLAAILPANMTSIQRFTLITVILAFIGWAGFSRVVRGMVLSIKNQEFIEASRAIGASSLRTIIHHVLPQTASYVIVAMTLSVPGYILAESGLSFLGLGIQQPDASWGNMLKEAQEYTNVIYRPWLLVPGGLIFIAVLVFNLVGDAVRDVLDPKSRERG